MVNHQLNRFLKCSEKKRIMMATKGFVYVMSNKSMPGVIKVGMSTKMPEKRAKELSSCTSSPTPFIVEYYSIFDDMIKAERMAHQRLKPHHHGKEFFSTTVENAIYSIEELGLSFQKIYSRTDYENEIRERRIKEKEAKEKNAIAQRERAEQQLRESQRVPRIKKAPPKEEKRPIYFIVRMVLSILGIIMFYYALKETNLADAVVTIMFGIGCIYLGNLCK